MFKKILILLLLSTVFCGESLSETTHQNLVSNFDGEQLVNAIRSHNYAFIVVMDKSKRINEVAPFVEKTIQSVVKNYPQIKVGRFQIDQWTPQIARQVHFEIDGQVYPMMYFYDHGFPVHYPNSYLLTPNSVVTWIKKYREPDMHWIQRQQINKLSANQRPYFICESQNKQIILKLMKFRYIHERFPIYCVKQANDKRNTLVAYAKNHNKEYHGDYSLHSLFDWFETTGTPLILRIQNLNDIGEITDNPKKLTLIFGADRQHITNQTQNFMVLEQICKVRSRDIECGYMDPEIPSLGSTFYQRLKVGRYSYFVALFKQTLKIGYLFNHSLLQINNDTKQELHQFINNVLNQSIPASYDSTTPKQKDIVYVNSQILTNLTFDDAVTKPDFYFVKFSYSKYQNSRSVFRSYENFAKNLKQKHNITAGVIDCLIYEEFCHSKSVKFYPEFVLFVKNTAIIFKKHQLPPSSENLLNFVESKIKNKIRIVSNEEQIMDKNCVIFQGAKLTDEISAFPFSYTAVPVYFIQKDEQYFGYRLFLVIQGVKIPFPNRLMNLHHDKAIEWIKITQSSMITHLTLDNLRVKESLPRFLLLCLPQNDQVEVYKSIFGQACKKLGINCRYIVRSFFNFNNMILKLRIQARYFQSETIFYIDQMDGQPIKYEGSIGSINSDDLKVFIERATNKKLSQLNGLIIANQELEDL